MAFKRSGNDLETFLSRPNDFYSPEDQNAYRAKNFLAHSFGFENDDAISYKRLNMQFDFVPRDRLFLRGWVKWSIYRYNSIHNEEFPTNHLFIMYIMGRPYCSTLNDHFPTNHLFIMYIMGRPYCSTLNDHFASQLWSVSIDPLRHWLWRHVTQ